MSRIRNRALTASVVLGLASVVWTGAPAGAADCTVPGAPVVQQLSMTPTTLVAPTGDAVAHTALAAQVDACGGDQLAVHVDVTDPGGQTQALEGFGPTAAADGTFGADVSWGAGDAGLWTFALVAETVDLGGTPQQASASLPFTVQPPPPPSPPAPPAPVPTVPGQPRDLLVGARTSAGGRLTWRVPATDGGSSVTGYRVVRPGADATLTRTARAYTVRGLQPAHTYTLRVQAENGQGYGASSSVRLTTLPSVPTRPRTVKVSARGTTSGRISWQAPASDGGASVTSYRVTAAGTAATVRAAAHSYTVRGLKPGHGYAVTVVARNAAGYGPGSSVTLRTLTTTPAKPRGLAVSKRTRTSAKVSWKAPATTGGTKVTGYRITKPGRDVTVKATARSLTVKGLKAGHTYTVKVKAKNARGYGANAAVTFTTKRSTGGGAGCTPGYSPCLPPASDYDCYGGSGDGPAYAHGPIYVTGSDPYDLDRDGDGVACEQ